MTSIKLIIKSANQKLSDQCVDCSLDWTVLELKSHLSKEYPSKPRIEDQRLIYSGHLLNNEQSLLDVLQPIDDNLTFTIHLVCAQRSQDSPRKYNTLTSNSNIMANNNNSNNNTIGDGVSATNNVEPQQTYINQIGVNPWMTNEQMVQQMAIMQQAYAQYMAQYFGQNSFNYYQAMPQINQINNQTPIMNVPLLAADQPIAQENVVQHDQAIPQLNPINPIEAPAAQPQPQIQRLNAGPGGGAIDDDDEANNRDWLDWFYWMSRALVLFSILYFYSSFNRFLLVVVLSLFLYLYQTGWINRRYFRNRPNIAPNPPNNNNNNNNDINRNEERVNDQLNNRAMEVANNSENNRLNISEPRVTEDRLLTGLRFCWVIVTSLFTSLIPEQVAPPVNIN